MTEQGLISEIIRESERDLESRFAEVERIEEIRTRQVIDIFKKESVSYRHFAPTTGYGYEDIGRDTLERIYAGVFHTEAALMRPHIASGTAALSLTLSGMTKPGEKVLSATGLPYDTLLGVLGIGKKAYPGSLKELGVGFDSVELRNGRIDTETVDRMVDNCYGEFVRDNEPTDFGADICVGSLIKNPGGGIAPTGGYIAGRKEDVERIAGRLTAPGLGRELGSYEASYRPFYQGLFMAPHTVAQALKTAMLAARIFEKLGFETTPPALQERADIIQAIRMESPERLVAFCQGLQAASPVDSMAEPQPWNMPGYDDQVVMAAGTFVAGASIELSADGPIRPPYTAFMQGGLTYSHGKIALSEALGRMMAKQCLDIDNK